MFVYGICLILIRSPGTSLVFAPVEVLLFNIKVVLAVRVGWLLGLVCLGWCFEFTHFGLPGV